MTTRRTLTLTIVLALTVAALPILVAAGGPGSRPNCDGDGPGPFARGGGPGMHGPGGFGGPGFGGPGLERFLDHAAGWLDLTEDQEAQIEAILETARPSMESLREQAQSQRQTFHDTFDPAAFDETAVRAFASQQSALHTEMMVAGLQTWSQVYQVLTPEQRAQLDEHRQKMQDRHGKHGHRGGPGRR